MSSDLFYPAYCTSCGECVGELDGDELSFLVPTGLEDVLCFECDTFENVSERVNCEFSHARTHERTHERTHARGLSSYTYLNRTQKNERVLFDGMVYEDCLLCLDGITYEGGISNPNCPICSGDGVVASAILLPAWVLGLGRENV